MALTERYENRSIRVSLMNDDGTEVMTLSGSYGTQNINLSFDMHDHAYCEAHVADVEDGIKAFMERFNSVLASGGLPQVKT